MKTDRGRGFTLIELLTVIAIIAILAGLTFAILPRVTERAKMRRMNGALLQIRTAMTSYYADSNTYPPGYGFVRWESRNSVTLTPEEQVYMLKPYTAALKIHGDQKMYDEFSDGYDTDMDGVISLGEFIPVGNKNIATNAITFPTIRYTGQNDPGGDLGRMKTNDYRPFVYAPVNQRQFAKARRYWIERRHFLAESWDPNDTLLSGISFPPPTYDAYVLISLGPGRNTFGVLPEPLGTEEPRDVYHILALRTFFLATRDLNDNGLLDFDFEARSQKGEAAQTYQIQVGGGTVTVDNKLPCKTNRDNWGPCIFVVK